MKLRILTPARAAIEADVTQVTIPGAAGQLTPMGGHDLLITPLTAGALFFFTEEKAERRDYLIGPGFAEVVKDGVTVFTSSAKSVTRDA
jgi:F-type H+-transporting ATPase subunit epsilon